MMNLKKPLKKRKFMNQLICSRKNMKHESGKKVSTYREDKSNVYPLQERLFENLPFLILDDSTSALDVKTETALWDALEKEEATMLVVTQKISTAKGADKILLLDEGQVVGYGTHDDLLKQSELYRRIAESQSEEEVEARCYA